MRDFWKGVFMFSKCFVTGGSGFLGRTLLESLQERCQEIYALVQEGDPLNSYIPEGIHVMRGDLREEESVEAFLATADSDSLVFHCAGIISVATKPGEQLYQVNVEGTRRILGHCLRKNVKRLIYVSSVHAIPEKKEGEYITEEAAFSPETVRGAYAKTKAMATASVIEAMKEGLRANIIFPSGIIGPGDYGRGSFTSMFLSFMEGKLPLAVGGGYDFVDVRDVAKGIILTAEKGRIGEGYILSGEYLKMEEILSIVKEKLSLPKMPIFLPRFLAEGIAPLYERACIIGNKPLFFTPYAISVLYSNGYFSRKKAEKELGYSPRGGAESIGDTLQWLKGIKNPKA